MGGAVGGPTTGTTGLPVAETSAAMRANGQSGDTGFFTNNGTTFDGVVLLGTTADIASAVHEIDEVMGGGGAGSMLNNQGTSNFCANFNPSGSCLGGTDLYRYSSNGTPSFNVGTGAGAAYFSFNGGVTNIANFNQQNSTAGNAGPYSSGASDAGDFTTTTCLIQSWQVCSPSDFNGTSYAIGSVEYQMEESVGWDPTMQAVPGPVAGTGLPGMVFAGAMGLFCWRRKRKPACIAA